MTAIQVSFSPRSRMYKSTFRYCNEMPEAIDNVTKDLSSSWIWRLQSKIRWLHCLGPLRRAPDGNSRECMMETIHNHRPGRER